MEEVQPDDLQNFGLIPEFIGRFPVITALYDLDEHALSTLHDRLSGGDDLTIASNISAPTMQRVIPLYWYLMPWKNFRLIKIESL